MSLVGSLEDLGLGDILQIVSLSRKSGVLMLRSEVGEGRIVLCEGLVRGAGIKGQPESLRDLLAAEDLLASDDFERAESLAQDRGIPIENAVSEVAEIDLEQLESLRRDQVERAAMRMFSWRSGEFSFEVHEEVEAEESDLLISTGISTQFLTMEATRLRDESSQPTALPDLVAGEDDSDSDEDPVFSGESDEPEVAAEETVEESAVDALALATAKNAAAEEEAESLDDPAPMDATPSVVEAEQSPPEMEAHDAAGAAEPLATEPAQMAAEEESGRDASEPNEVAEPSEVAVGAESAELQAIDVSMAPTPGADTKPPAAAARRTFDHLVAIDPNLAGLEWFKASVEGMFTRIHIFQRSEIGVDRIRHYLGRGIVPVVVISPRATGDPMTCVRNVGELIQRLRTLAPKIPILAMIEQGAAQPKLRALDRVITRPASPGADPEQWGRFEDAAQRLREALAPWSDRSVPTESSAPPEMVQPDLERIQEVSDRLRDPSTQGEVLSLVLGFAAECFSRVAIFMIRDHLAAGMVQKGIQRAGGPDDDALRKIQFDDASGPELFLAAVEQRASVRSSMSEPGNQRLAALLGGTTPGEAYVAPIESGGCVVALLYADNLPEERPLPETAGLEIVLREAGLALDRALLERTLASAAGDA